jgi:hypothetical protein
MSEVEKIAAETYLEVKRLREDVEALKSLLNGSHTLDEGWKEGAIAWKLLQCEGVKSQGHLADLRQAGVFCQSRGEIRTKAGKRPTWQYNIKKCRKALQRYYSG